VSVCSHFAQPAADQGDDFPKTPHLPYRNFDREVASNWLLPDGVSDVLFDDAQKQEVLRHSLIQKLLSHGYQLVSPPMIEFTESLLSDASEDLKRQTFKIIDQLTGRLMGLRADITPQILRIDRHHGGMGIARYCYAGQVIHTLPNGLFGSRTPLQLGAEIFGCTALAADIELINMLFAMLSELNLNAQLHIDLGHVAIFERLSLLAELTEDDSHQLMQFYANKNLPELKRFCQSFAMGDDFYALARFGHDIPTLLQTLSQAAKADAVLMEAAADLMTLKAHLEQQWQCQVSIDVTELSGYHYHTGIVFNGYINNESQPLVRGGRFDGKKSQSRRAATGFSLDVSRLVNHIALTAPKIVVVDFADLQSADSKQSAALQKTIHELRDLGACVTLPLSQEDIPNKLTHRLALVDDAWQLMSISA